MTDFEQAVKTAAEKAVLQFVQGGQWLQPNYESRLKIPVEWVADCWRLVDAEKLKRKIAERLESELAERMVNHMASELATDIKQILSVSTSFVSAAVPVNVFNRVETLEHVFFAL